MVRPIKHSGFTLVELVMVIVLVGIIAGSLTPMILQSVTAYQDTQSRSELVARGRVALERLARELRHAAPNSLQVLNNGGATEGIEFLSCRRGGRYVDQNDDFGTSTYTNRFRRNANLNQLDVVGTDYVRQANDLLVIGNTTPADLIAGDTVSAISANPVTFNADGVGGNDSQTLSFNNNQFPYDSPGKHFAICDTSYEVGRSGNAIHWHTATGMTDYDGNQDWAGGDPVLVDGVTALDFAYSAGTPQSAGVLRIDLELTNASEVIRLYHEVHVRNTP